MSVKIIHGVTFYPLDFWTLENTDFQDQQEIFDFIERVKISNIDLDDFLFNYQENEIEPCSKRWSEFNRRRGMHE